jgi:hypothetical protein
LEPCFAFYYYGTLSGKAGLRPSSSMDLCDIRRLAPDALTLNKGDTMSITFIDSKDISLQPDPNLNQGKGKIKTWTKGGGVVMDVTMEDIDGNLRSTGSIYTCTLNTEKGFSISINNNVTGERMVLFTSQQDPATYKANTANGSEPKRKRTAKATGVDVANPLGE